MNADKLLALLTDLHDIVARPPAGAFPATHDDYERDGRSLRALFPRIESELRALAQPAEAVAVVEACTEAAIRESTQPSYSDESPRASWRRVVRAVLDTARNANRTDAAQGAVAKVVGFDRGLPDLEWVNTVPLAKGDNLYTHPQAAPAQGDGMVPVAYYYRRGKEERGPYMLPNTGGGWLVAAGYKEILLYEKV